MILDLIEHEISTPVKMEKMLTSALPVVSDIVAETECENISAGIFNGTDSVVIQNMFQCIGGMTHA